jgi:hypothetical protein
MAPTLSASATRARQSAPMSDLLYLAGDRLMRWDPLTYHSITLAQNVADFALSADGQVIVLSRPQKVAANGVQQFDLDALRLAEQRIFTLVDSAVYPRQIRVSPDGSSVAYTQELPEGVSIFVAPVSALGQPRKLGLCQPAPKTLCPSLTWSPDGRDLLWSDALGLWQASMAGQQPQLIYPNKVQVEDPKGQPLEIEAQLTELQFGTNERFVLLKVIPLASQVGWQAVLDRRSGYLAQAQETYGIRSEDVQVQWLSDGNLLVAHASEPGRRLPPYIHLWSVLPTNPELLVSGQKFDLYSDEFPFSAAQSKAIPAHCLLWPTQIQSNRLAFVVRLDQSDDPPALFELNLITGALTRLRELPDDTTQVLWSPDKTQALVLGVRNRISLLSLKSGELISLESVLMPQAHQFVWMPPALRK